MPTTVSCSLGRPYTCDATAPSTPRGSSTTHTASPVARASASPAGSVRTATAPRAAASAAYRAPCVRAPGSAAYRSPGRTSPEARLAPVTAVPGSPWTGRPTRSARSARGRGRVPEGRGTAPGAVGLTSPPRRLSSAAFAELLCTWVCSHTSVQSTGGAVGPLGSSVDPCAPGPGRPGQGTVRVNCGRGAPEGTTPPAV